MVIQATMSKEERERDVAGADPADPVAGIVDSFGALGIGENPILPPPKKVLQVSMQSLKWACAQ